MVHVDTQQVVVLRRRHGISGIINGDDSSEIRMRTDFN